jgi:Protein of unknown function (DUF2971)
MTEQTSLTGILDQMERELVRKLPRDRPTGSLFHYTGSNGLFGILKDRCIWATDFRCLNDSEELLLGERVVQEEAKILADTMAADTPEQYIFSQIAEAHARYSLTKVTGVYLTSLSESPDSLSQWRAYGANGSGYCVGIDPASFPLPDGSPEGAQAMLTLIKCEYDQTAFRTRVHDELGRLAQGFKTYVETHANTREDIAQFEGRAISLALRVLGGLVLYLKHAAFSEEREWRLVVIPVPGSERKQVKCRATARGIAPYMTIPLGDEQTPMKLSQVWAGPCQVAGAEAILTTVLRLHGYDQPSLALRSTAPYRGQ